MSELKSRMEALLGETDDGNDPLGTHPGMRQRTGRVPGSGAAEETEVNAKAVIPQLVLAMQATGLDPTDEDQLDQFMKLLKTLVTSKSQMVKTAIKNWTGAKASRALRVAKKAV